MREKKTSSATPMQISGMTMGSAMKPSVAALPGKRKRHRSSAVMAPMMVAMMVHMTAMASELTKASTSEASRQATRSIWW
jgi:hypothetical protein